MSTWICDKCGAEVQEELMSYTNHQKNCTALLPPPEEVKPHEAQTREERLLRARAKPFDPTWLKMTGDEKAAMLKAAFDPDPNVANDLKKAMQIKYSE